MADTQQKQGLNVNGDGTSVLRVGDKEWALGRPTFKQYREAVVASDKALKPGAAPAEVSLTDPVVHAYQQWAPARFAWWRAIVKALSDKPFPAKDDDLPLWLASADPINAIMEHWLSSPPEAPGG